MIKNQKLRLSLISLCFFFALLWILPNISSLTKKIWWPTREKIVYGLDIQGGLHLVLGANIKKALSEKMDRFLFTFKEDLKKEKVLFQSIKKTMNPNGEPTWMVIEVKEASHIEDIRNFIEKDDPFSKRAFSYKLLLQEIRRENTKISFRYNEQELLLYKKKMIDQVIQIIRNRIDEFGVSEPSIAAQGDQRVLVQLPGINNADQAKKLLSQTGQLHFRGVLEDITQESLTQMILQAEAKGKYSLGKNSLTYKSYVNRINQDLKKDLPENSYLLFEKNPNATNLEAGKVPYLVETISNLTGDMLEGAYVGPGERGFPVVNLRFGLEGRKKFSEMTEKNKGKRIAIILDKVINSAPVVREKIRDGNAQISLAARTYNEALDEANLISTTLNAGALPIELELLEERRVGPTLGADSIAKGKKAGLIAALLILLFMLIYYRFLGLIANISLSLNILFIFAILSSLGATLTLPGVAGMILTLGMAVDANIIIFERIKEELRKGSGKKSAIQNGFQQAFSAIFDTNITTAAICVILIYFGTGPVRGFAVTLIIGIMTSMFTAIFVSRTFIELCLQRFKNIKIFNFT